MHLHLFLYICESECAYVCICGCITLVALGMRVEATLYVKNQLAKRGGRPLATRDQSSAAQDNSGLIDIEERGPERKPVLGCPLY